MKSPKIPTLVYCVQYQRSASPEPEQPRRERFIVTLHSWHFTFTIFFTTIIVTIPAELGLHCGGGWAGWVCSEWVSECWLNLLLLILGSLSLSNYVLTILPLHEAGANFGIYIFKYISRLIRTVWPAPKAEEKLQGIYSKFTSTE